MDCGPTCLRMVAKHYGRHYNADTLRRKAGFSKAGVSLLGISETAEKIGFRTRGIRLTLEQLTEVKLPCILHWNQNHFVVLVSVSGNSKISGGGVKIADPSKNGVVSFSRIEFESHWATSENEEREPSGIALLLEPTPAFFVEEGEKEHKLSWKLVLQYLTQSRWQLVQVLMAVGITSLISLIFPFLTQGIVDTGINGQDLSYVTVILIAQLMLIFSRTLIDFIRSRLLLRVSNMLNLQILSDFWIKLTKLPIAYFDTHHTGDTLQRIGDHRQIQNFLTGTALNTLFSLFNFIVYAVVLVIYSVQLFFVFLIGSIIYFAWILFFLRIRRRINYQTFHLSAKENNATLQLVQGMQELRLNNAEKQKRWYWENIQASIFKLNFKTLNYNQWQQAGATLINGMQDLAITFIVAKLVIEGQLTLGAMVAIQYIIGQLSGPVNQWVGFVQSAQDAKISMERLNEVHQLDDEEIPGMVYTDINLEKKSIQLQNVSFTYPGAGNEPVLKNINLVIPDGKVTAIVGVSGSGKTTMLKLLLKIYMQYEGMITLGNVKDQRIIHDPESNNQVFSEPGSNDHPMLYGTSFRNISPTWWRKKCGSVMQEGFVFNDTIAANIALGSEDIDYDRLISSCDTANILSFIESLPNGFYTEIGTNGTGLSQGQKQRLLIARAVYKNPDFLFFDEATNSLDANNEREIVEKLDQFFKNKTVVIVAHRLSTVKNADKIVVLHQGEIVEEGSHEELTKKKGAYYELVKNQLELGV